MSDLPTLVSEGALPGKLVASHAEKTLPRSMVMNASETNKRDLDDGVDGDSVLKVLRGTSEGAETAHVSAGESKRITELPEGCGAWTFHGAPRCSLPQLRRFGLFQQIVPRLQVRVRESLDCVSGMSLTFPSLNSSLGSLSSARARVALSAAPASARVCPGFSYLAVSAAAAHTHASILHGACYHLWSDTGSAQGPRGRKRVKEGVSDPDGRFASCLRGGGGGKFSASQQCTGAGCRFTPRKATRHRYQEGQGRCGHTFPPPRGS